MNTFLILSGRQTVSAADIVGLQTLVQNADGPTITDASAQAGTGATTAGQRRMVSDGQNAGIWVRCAIPAGGSVLVWCWDIYPLEQYQG